MNYIWEILLQAKKEKLNEDEIIFTPAVTASPYMEASLQDINRRLIGEDKTIEINPFYRFYPIFKDFLHIDRTEDEEIRKTLFNIIIHYLGYYDLKQGLSKEEYYKKFLMRDIEEGVFGEEVKNAVTGFAIEEINVLLSGMLRLYETGTSLFLYKTIVHQIFPKSVLYNNQDSKKQLLLYLGEKKTNAVVEKIEMLNYIFLRLDYHVLCFYEYHFGILGVGDTMYFDEIEML